jgi:DNA replication protein DnaC
MSGETQVKDRSICEEHNLPRKRHEEPGGFVWYEQCTGCEKDSAAREAEIEAEKAEEIAHAREYKTRELLKRLIVPERYKEAEIENFNPYAGEEGEKQREMLEVVDTFLNRTERAAEGPKLIGHSGLLLLGHVGTGKTHIGYGIAKKFIRQECREAQVYTMSEMVDEIQETFDRSSGKKKGAVLKNFKSLGLLVIDEVGMQPDTDSVFKIITAIITDREKELLPTVLIANLTIEELNENLGHVVMDRMRGASPAIFDWQSYRVLKQAKGW